MKRSEYLFPAITDMFVGAFGGAAAGSASGNLAITIIATIIGGLILFANSYRLHKSQIKSD